MSKTKFKNSIEFEVWGDEALFSEVLTRTGGEKFSMDYPTYEALKGIVHSIYYKPTIMWVIDEVRIMNPVKRIRKGILTKKHDGSTGRSYYAYLRNVRYQVKAHFEWNDNRPELACDRNENKHHNIAKKALEHGGRRDIFLGARECQAYVKPCKFGEGESVFDNVGEINLGHTYHGITYADEAINEDDKGYMTVRFWDAKMVNGVIKFCRPEQCTVKRHIHKMSIKPFGKENGNFSGLREFKEEEVNGLE